MRTIIHFILMLAVLIQPLPAAWACVGSAPCAPVMLPDEEKCCCCSGLAANDQVACGCSEPAKQAPATPVPDHRPSADLFPALPPTVLDLVSPRGIDHSSEPRSRIALRGGSPSTQSLLCVWRT